jgi:hypothetical protein
MQYSSAKNLPPYHLGDCWLAGPDCGIRVESLLYILDCSPKRKTLRLTAVRTLGTGFCPQFITIKTRRPSSFRNTVPDELAGGTLIKKVGRACCERRL